MAMLKWKWLWLVAGVICGTVFSASSEERRVQSVNLRVSAVSLEDAEDRASEILGEETQPGLERAKVIAAFRPACVSGDANASFYRCSARVLVQ